MCTSGPGPGTGRITGQRVPMRSAACAAELGGGRTMRGSDLILGPGTRPLLGSLLRPHRHVAQSREPCVRQNSRKLVCPMIVNKQNLIFRHQKWEKGTCSTKHSNYLKRQRMKARPTVLHAQGGRRPDCCGGERGGSECESRGRLADTAIEAEGGPHAEPTDQLDSDSQRLAETDHTPARSVQMPRSNQQDRREAWQLCPLPLALEWPRW